MKLYHRDYGFPVGTSKAITSFVNRLPADITGGPHYRERRESKGLPVGVSRDWLTKAALIELQVIDRRIHRALFRGTFDRGRDLSVVIESGIIVTGWLNNKTDIHRLTGERSERYIKVREGTKR